MVSENTGAKDMKNSGPVSHEPPEQNEGLVQGSVKHVPHTKPYLP